MSKKFFDAVRESLFNGTLAPRQVDGMNVLLSECNKAGLSKAYTAYVLATAYHETAKTMQPIKEFGGHDYFMKNYDITGKNPDRARKYGNTQPGDGARYCGRGYVQLTWKSNYAFAEKKLGVPLVAQPDLAMDTVIAASIAIAGMREGWFTGKKLSDYITTGTPSEMKAARKIINGTDKDVQIANYAAKFLQAL